MHFSPRKRGRTADLPTSRRYRRNLNERYAHVSRLETLNDSAQEEILSLNGKIDLANVDIRQAGTEKNDFTVEIGREY